METDGKKHDGCNTDAASGRAAASLVDELRSLAESAAKAESEADVEYALARVRQLRSDFICDDCTTESAETTHAMAAELIELTESRLEQLRSYLAYKRRVQEGEAMEKIARRRKAESLAVAATAAVAGAAAFIDAISPAKGEPAPERAEKAADDFPSPPAQDAAAPAKPSQNDRPAEASDAGDKPPVPNAQSEAEPKPSRTYRLIAHMVGAFLEDPEYFKKLRADMQRGGRQVKAPVDNAAAESHFRTIHDLNVRLVNIEMSVRAIAANVKKNAPIAPLFATASRQISGFMRGVMNAMAEKPDMTSEYDRLFSGYTRRFSSIEPEKGADILAQCLAEQKRANALEKGDERRPADPQGDERRPAGPQRANRRKGR